MTTTECPHCGRNHAPDCDATYAALHALNPRPCGGDSVTAEPCQIVCDACGKCHGAAVNWEDAIAEWQRNTTPSTYHPTVDLYV